MGGGGRECVGGVVVVDVGCELGRLWGVVGRCYGGCGGGVLVLSCGLFVWWGLFVAGEGDVGGGFEELFPELERVD